MNVLDATGLCKSFGSRTILSDVGFTVGEDEKVGLIGMNGCGKSSLLAMLAGEEERDAGVIVSRRGATVGYLAQEPLLDDTLTVAEAIEQGLREIRRVTTEFERVTAQLASPSVLDTDKLLRRQGELASWIEHHGGWQTDHLVTEVMTHLHLPCGDQLLGTLSGGTRRRVALARLLLEAPDLLLLDEPTNHLDADCTQWLQEYLVAYRGAVLLVTHDRYFLDCVANRMLELEDGSLTSYRGGYSDYLLLREERLRLETRTRSRLLNLLRTETAWMERGAKARTTKQKARIGRFEELRKQCTSPGEREAQLSFAGCGELGGTVLELRGVAKSYDDHELFKGLTFRLRRGERVGIIGPNGCGKTTLIRLAVGEESTDAGEVVVGKKTRIAYFDQHRSLLVPEQTIYDFLGEGDYVVCGGERRHKIGYLEEFLFSPGDRMRPVGTLSGGEKSRLILARLMLEDANLLIFDEPTNDLDIPTLQLLDEALIRFPGSLLMVTHDRFFLDKVATGILAFEEGSEVLFSEGNYSYYREQKARRIEEKREQERKRKEEKGRAAAVGVQRTKQGLTYAERLELAALEEEIGELEGRLVAVEAQLADPGSYGDVAGGVVGLSGEYGRLQDLIAERYQRWEQLETKRGA